MEVITEIAKEDLNFVLCFYDDIVMHHEYNKYNGNLKTGQPLTLDSLKAIFSFVNSNEELKVKKYGFKDIITKRVLKFSPNSKEIIWVTESMQTGLLFKCTGFKSGKYRIPPVLWILKNKSLQVFALKSTEAITMNTDVFYAPFFNVNSKGDVCMGTAYFNNRHTDYGKITADVEDKFFNSYFTHSQNEMLSADYKKYMQNIRGKDEFDVSLLIDTKMKIKNLL